jgi:hypothetical protein
MTITGDRMLPALDILVTLRPYLPYPTYVPRSAMFRPEKAACSAFASFQGARSQTSRSSSVVRTPASPWDG